MRDGEAPEHGHAELAIELLGGFRVTRWGETIPASAWQKRGKAQALVKLLALTPGHRLQREQILDAIWPDLDPDAADRSLRKAVHYARHALEPELRRGRAARYLLVQGGAVCLAPHLLTIDIDRFRERAQSGLRQGECSGLDEALSLYKGELLPEDRYEDWTVRPREDLSDLHVRLLRRQAEVLVGQGNHAAAIDHLRQVLAVDPTHEEVHRAIMRTHARAGNVHAALLQYAACVRTLRRELDAEPEEETERLRREITSLRISVPVLAERTQAPLPPLIRQTPVVPFIGRERARELLMEWLAGATGGHGRLVLVGGEAGVGKTRLVAEIARAGHTQGALVLWGGSYEPEGMMPYGAIVEALEGYLEELPEVERTALIREHPVLERLLPSLSTAESLPLDLTSGESKAWLFASVVRLLRDLSADMPVVLVLDDLHAADSAMLALLHHVARAASRERWLIMGTHREEDLRTGGGLHRVRTVLTRSGNSQRIDLHGLPRADTDRLTETLLPQGRVPQGVAAHLHSLSSGNPLFLEELVQSMRERHELLLREGEWTEAASQQTTPGGVRALVEERVHRLGQHAERMLAVAAVVGMEVRFDILQAATGLDIESLVRALDRSLEARVLEEAGAQYVFRHTLVRAALYDRLAEQQRTQLHGMVGEAIEAVRPEDVEVLSHHFVRAGNEGKAVHYLELAGDRAARTFAGEAAIQFYADVARILTRSDRAAWVRVTEKLGTVRHTLGQFPQAEASFLAALDESSDPVQRTRLRRLLARTWENRGDFARALAILDTAEAENRKAGHAIPPEERVHSLVGRAEALIGLARFAEASVLAKEALAILEGGNDPLQRAQVHYLQSRIWMRMGEYAQVLETCRQGLAVAEEAGDLRGIAACLSGMAVAAANLGDTEAADAYQRRGIQVSERMGDQHGVATGWNNLGVSAHTRGDFALARECYLKSLRIREEIDDREGLAVSWINLGEAALFQGDLEEAEEDCQRSRRLHGETNDAYGVAYVKATQAAILFSRQDPGGAERLWQESLAMRQEIGDGQGIVDCQIGLAEVALAQGRLAEAYQAGRRARHIAKGRAPELEARSALLQAKARIAEGHCLFAGPLIAHARSLVEKHALGRLDVHVSLLEASCSLAAGNDAASVQAAEEALRHAARRGMRIEEGVARDLIQTVHQGDVHKEQGSGVGETRGAERLCALTPIPGDAGRTIAQAISRLHI